MTHRLARNTLALSLVQITNYIAPLFVLVYLTNILGVDLYGILAFSQGVVALSFVITDLGYGLSATEKISKRRGDVRYVSNLIGGVFAVKLLLIVIVSIVVIAYATTTTKYQPHSLVFFVSILPIAAQGLLPIWFFHGIEKMKFVAFIAVSSKILFAVLTIMLVKTPDDYYFVPALNGITQIAALGISITLIYKLGYKISFPTKRIIFYCIAFTRSFFLSRVAVAFYMNSATVILGLSSTAADVAIYSIADQVYKAMQSAFSPISGSAYPYMSKEKDIKLMLKIILGCIALALIGALIGYLITPALFSMFFSETWMDSIPVINVFFIGIVVHAAAVIMGYPLAAAVGRVQVANSSVVAGSVVYGALLGLAFVLRIVTPVSLAAIMVLSELYVLIHRTWVLLPVAIKRCEDSTERR